MAVKLRKRGRIWWVYIDWKGLRVARSLRITDRREAEKARRKIRERLEAGDKPFENDSSHAVSFQAYSEEWLERAWRRLRPSTFIRYTTGIRAAQAFFGKKGLNEITKADALRFAESMRLGRHGRPLRESSLRNLLASLQTMYNDACYLGVVSSNPFERKGRLIRQVIPRGTDIEESDSEPVAYTRTEQERLLRMLEREDLSDYVAVLLGLRAGLRRSEALALRREDLDLEGRYLHVRRRVSRGALDQPKSEASRRKVPLSRDLLDAIRRLIREQNEIALHHGKPPPTILLPARNKMTEQTEFQEENRFGRRFRAYIRRADVQPRVHPFHRLRHTFASELLTAGVPIFKVSKWLGHASIQLTVDTYGHLLTDPGEHEVIDLVARRDISGSADAAIRNKSATPGVEGKAVHGEGSRKPPSRKRNLVSAPGFEPGTGGLRVGFAA